MYGYYFLSSMGIKLGFIRPFITIGQLLQFLVIAFQSFIAGYYGSDCGFAGALLQCALAVPHLAQTCHAAGSMDAAAFHCAYNVLGASCFVLPFLVFAFLCRLAQACYDLVHGLNASAVRQLRVQELLWQKRKGRLNLRKFSQKLGVSRFLLHLFC